MSVLAQTEPTASATIKLAPPTSKEKLMRSETRRAVVCLGYVAATASTQDVKVLKVAP